MTKCARSFKVDSDSDMIYCLLQSTTPADTALELLQDVLKESVFDSEETFYFAIRHISTCHELWFQGRDGYRSAAVNAKPANVPSYSNMFCSRRSLACLCLLSPWF